MSQNAYYTANTVTKLHENLSCAAIQYSAYNSILGKWYVSVTIYNGSMHMKGRITQ